MLDWNTPVPADDAAPDGGVLRRCVEPLLFGAPRAIFEMSVVAAGVCLRLPVVVRAGVLLREMLLRMAFELCELLFVRRVL
ncbi:MAG: hypothetical protein KAR11_05195 [Phycisphaerae bacterium]|nr:hypothetical protein [Phycisphaerae bacterium]